MKRQLTEAQYNGLMQYMATQTLQGLAQLERQGIVHNDISTDNLMCDATTGDVKIVDFGVAMDVGSQVQDIETPFFKGSASPDLRPGVRVTTKHDMFSIGALIRESMEGDQFRYNTKATENVRLDGAWQAYGRRNERGEMQQALHNKVPTNVPSTPAAVAATDEDRLKSVFERSKRLLSDPVIKQSDVARELTKLNTNAREALDLAATANNGRTLFETALSLFETKVKYAETNLRTTGTWVIGGDYMKLVNDAMSPDPSKRPTIADALDPAKYGYLGNPSLPPDEARALLIQILNPRQAASPASTSASAATPAVTPAAPLEVILDDATYFAQKALRAPVQSPPSPIAGGGGMAFVRRGRRRIQLPSDSDSDDDEADSKRADKDVGSASSVATVATAAASEAGHAGQNAADQQPVVPPAARRAEAHEYVVADERSNTVAENSAASAPAASATEASAAGKPVK